eukprot:7414120-Pyramimonas_sp.AAC.1
MQFHTYFGAPFIRFACPKGAPAKAPVAAPACSSTRHFGAPLRRFVVPFGAPLKASLAAPACGSIPIPVHPSDVSWPPRELHRRPQWLRPHAVPPRI